MAAVDFNINCLIMSFCEFLKTRHFHFNTVFFCCCFNIGDKDMWSNLQTF